MTIQAGDKFPSVKLKHLTSNGMQEVSTDDLLKGKKVVLFAVPGAFTPTCSAKHLPGFVQRADEFKAKGYELICMAVNDPFVMEAWGRSADVGDKILMLPDGNGTLTRELGLEMDASGNNLGKRSKRFAMVIDDGVVKVVNVEAPGAFDVSGADAILQII